MGLLSQDLAQRIRQYIAERDIQPGMRLPSERELAEQFAVSRGAIREALRELQIIGIVEKQPRSGTFIRSLSPAATLSFDWDEVDAESVRQIFEMRMLIEPRCAALAAVRATDEEIQTLHEALNEMRRAIDDEAIDAFQASDKRMHYVITRATGNQYLIQLLEAMTNALEQSVRISLHIPGQMARALAGHQQIVTAIENRQAEWASAAMETHLRDAWHYISAQVNTASTGLALDERVEMSAS
ncbi:MAG: FadR/GntR family transcriptional regulator [Aggregatilineales bacterium]